MFHAVIIVAVCDILSSLHGFAHAVPRHHSWMKHSHDLANSHRSFHDFDRTRNFEDRQPVSYDGRVSRKHIAGGRGLISGLVGNFVKGAAGVALTALKTGHNLILPPLKGVEWITGKASGVIGLNKSLLKSIASTVKSAWKRAKAIEFPGKSIIALVFPNRIVSIADKLTNNVMNFATKTKAAIKATVAYSLYAALNVIFSTVTTTIKTLGFACIPMNKTSLELNAGLISTVEISGGDICGLDTLQPENNVTITKDDGSFMVVTMPWVFRNLNVKIKSMDVTGWVGSLIKDQPVETTVEEIGCQGTISFQKGTFLKFMALHLELVGITGIHIKLEGATEEGGVAAGVINGLAEPLGGVIQNLVNAKLVEMEKQISDYLLGNGRR